MKAPSKILTTIKDVTDIFGDSRLQELRVSDIDSQQEWIFKLDCGCLITIKHAERKWSAICDSEHKRFHAHTNGLTEYDSVIGNIRSWDCER